METEIIAERPKAVGRWIPHTPGFLRQRPWVWPLVAAGVLAFVAIWVRGRIERAMDAHVVASLQTVLNANAEALREWARATRSLAEVLADDEHVRELATAQLRRVQSQGTSPVALKAGTELAALTAYLQPAAEARGFTGYALLDTNLVVVASETDLLLGLEPRSASARILEPCLAGMPTVTHPFLAGDPGSGGPNRPDAARPMMFAAAPVRARDGAVIAILGLGLLPETDFTRILGTARQGQSGETYVFDRSGVLLSESRFNDELKRLGLIPDKPDARSTLGIELRDPLVNLQSGRQAPRRRSELPLLRMVGEALAGRPGASATGDRDYRGVPVVTAWTWLPDFDMGLITQQDRREAFAPVLPIRYGFLFLFVLLTAASLVVFLLMRVARQAASEARQLGQYSLETELGSGGFGTVYRARHALMRRAVAVKVLSPFAAPNSVARFEREVQLTSQLTHPNTIAIFDYGRTPEDLFYYVMEYLEGISLADLIEDYGPQPEGRVIQILRQVCGSLGEAHGLGLVHRDIKPHNILLTRRGGIPDFVKVLDFGLVKAREQGELELTREHATLGTPLYMSPEAVKGAETATAASDMYSVGAVAFELVTGQPLFAGRSIGELFLHHVRSQPDKPSDRLRRPVSPDLEGLILRCLEKNPDARPGALELEQALGQCVSSNTWTRDEARQWWTEKFKPRGAKPEGRSGIGAMLERDLGLVGHRL